MDEYDSLEPEQICQILRERWGFRTEPDIPKETLLIHLRKFEKENRESAIEINKKAIEKYNALFKHNNVPLEPLIKIRFDHHDGDRELEFRFLPQQDYLDEKGQTKLRMPTTGKGANATWSMEIPRWKFIKGQTYDIPFGVHKHLNTRIVPDAIIETDPETGQDKSVPVLRRRFTSSPQVSREQAERLQGKKQPA